MSVLNNHLHTILGSLVSCEKKWVIFSNISSRVWKSMKIISHGHRYELYTVVHFRSSLPEVFCKEGVLINFTKFTGKHLSLSLFFSKVAGVKPATLLKKRLRHWCFPVNFVKFIRTLFLTEHLWWLLLEFRVGCFM